jgi:putative hydrolase of the HAD superfamily
MSLKVIAFDADDTLWVNEPYFQETEKKFCALLEDYLPHHTIMQELFKTEMQTLSLYGYGIKGFVLSMIETALRVSNNNVSLDIIEKIIHYGKDQMEHPIEMLDGHGRSLAFIKKEIQVGGCNKRRSRRPGKKAEKVRARTLFSPYRNYE